MSTSTERVMTQAEKDELRQQRRADAERQLAELLTEPGWRAWLQMRRTFRELSWTNQALIAMAIAAKKYPPGMVKAKWRWKRDGYHPAKGSHALTYIWVYASKRRKRDDTWGCSCGRRVKAPVCGDCREQDHYFKLGPVFHQADVVDADGNPPPPQPRPLPVEGDDLAWLVEPFLVACFERGWISGYELDCDPSLHPGALGWHNAHTGTVHLVAGLSGNAAARVAVHEVAHARGLNRRNETDTLTYAEAEVLVDCIAYMACSALDVDVSDSAIPYIAGWGGEQSIDTLRARAQLIDEHARAIEDVIDTLIVDHAMFIDA